MIDVILVADEAIVTKANKASFAKANNLLANDGITIVLYLLTKYCEVFAKDKEYFGMTISNNQLGRWNSCSLRSQNGTCRVENVFLS